MSVDLAKYVVSLEAETARYQQQLAAANGKLEQFEKRNTASLSRMDKGFSGMSLSVSKLRNVLGAFGIALSGRAFFNWIARSVEATDAVGAQAEAVGKAKKALDDYKRASDSLGESLAVVFTPVFQEAAKAVDGFRAMIQRTNTDVFNQALDDTNAEIALMQKLLANNVDLPMWLRELFNSDEQATVLVNRIKELNDKVAHLQNLLRNEAPSGGGLELIDVAAIGRQKIAVNEITEMIRKTIAAQTAAGQDLSPEIKLFVDQVQRGQELTEQMATDVENQVEQWHEIQNLLNVGAISEEAATRWRDDLLQPIEVTAKRLETIKDKAAEAQKQLGETFGSALQSTLADAFAGIETDFGGLIKRMIAELAASGLVQAIGAVLGSKVGGFGSFFSGFVGARASGGPVAAGSGYLVGEEGPELFRPNVSGVIMNSRQFAAGAPIHIEQHLHFDVGLESVDERIKSAAAPISQATMAAVMKFVNRPRMS